MFLREVRAEGGVWAFELWLVTCLCFSLLDPECLDLSHKRQTVSCGFFSCVHVCRVMCLFAGLSACVGVLLQVWLRIGGFLHIFRSVSCILGFYCVFVGMIVYGQMWMQ